ncbi:MAG TPA: ATP-binding protein [Longimicrobium sp.]|nr:ATP-binding protein [Longimicrobium sp.]
MSDPDVIPLRASPADAAPAPTLRGYALAAVADAVVGDIPPASPSPEAAFLLAHARAAGPEWRAGLVRYLAAPAPADTPLVRLAAALALTPIEVLAVALAAAVEDDVMVGRAFAHLQAPLGGSRPTLSLLSACLAEAAPEGTRPIDVLASGAAVRTGLLTILGDNLPLPERAAAVPVHLCHALAGLDGAWPGGTIGAGSLPLVPLPASAAAEAERHARALTAAPGQTLVIRAGSPIEGRWVAAAVAQAAGRRPLFVETESTAALGPWLLARGLLPVFCGEMGPGERRILPAIPGWNGPMMALTGPEGTVESAAGAVPSWTVPVPPRAERETLWMQALGTPDAAASLARDHRHGSGRIAHLGRLARHRAVLDGRDAATRDDVLQVSRGGDGAALGALAQPLPASIPDAAMVAGPQLRAELEMLLLRCRIRDGLTDGLGVATAVRYAPGVRALFVGPSGTGKTLAAGWLATKLGLPLYRVDLASVTSKYIGETEKNLAQLLSRAEQAEVVLLFDEADSLFGKRTDVRDSNDRFANAQTNYLLQRIESFDGIALLTSNSRTRFDSAFTRRLDAIVEFGLPGPEERRGLWEAHLGTGHSLAPRDLNRLAATADLGGGHIRNAVLAAAVLAHHAGRPIAYDDVTAGLTVEYRKLGKQLPVGLRSS